ncbi:MAG: fibronectin type III domain-containing protein [Spirochaetales bacterium]|nr:fibronectin type III domain-containing protein [Spirochaetales bacterium]
MKKKNIPVSMLGLLIIWSCQVPDPPEQNTIPEAPTDLAASAINYNSLTMTWTDNSDNEDNFILLKSADNTFTSTSETELAADTTEYADTDVIPETVYFYRLFARNISGDSGSIQISITTAAAPPVPTAPMAPENFGSADYDYNYIILAWDDMSDNEESFILQKSLDGDFSTSPEIGLAAGTETYTDNDVLPETTYYYRLCAWNTVGNSTHAETSVATPADPGPAAPAAPSGITLIDASDRAVFVKWTDNAGNEDNYLVRRSLTADFSVYEEYPLDPDSEYFRDTSGISQNTDYYYRVLAQNTAATVACPDTLALTTETSGTVAAGKLVADHTIVYMVREGKIPVTDIENAKNLVIAYGHTSHGSQLTNGMSGLIAFANSGNCDGDETYSATPDLFNWNHNGADGALHLYEGDGYGSGDLDHDCGYYDTTYTYDQYAVLVDGGGTPAPNWEYETRYYLGEPTGPEDNERSSNHPEVDVIIWSWCGQSAGKSLANMGATYLNPMAALEEDYSGIIFVYMTGHLTGNGAYHTANDYIRDYCADNGKWLFDFADIESYDPDGINYTVGSRTSTDGCIYDFNLDGSVSHSNDITPTSGDRSWGTDWQNDHIRFEGVNGVQTDWYNCGSDHSQPVNANMKAFAAWWLWCRLAGWDVE